MDVLVRPCAVADAGRTEVGHRHFEVVLGVTRYPLTVTESGLAVMTTADYADID